MAMTGQRRPGPRRAPTETRSSTPLSPCWTRVEQPRCPCGASPLLGHGSTGVPAKVRPRTAIHSASDGSRSGSSASVRCSPAPSSQPFPIPRSSARAATSLPGSAWCRDRTQRRQGAAGRHHQGGAPVPAPDAHSRRHGGGALCRTERGQAALARATTRQAQGQGRSGRISEQECPHDLVDDDERRALLRAAGRVRNTARATAPTKLGRANRS